MRMSRLTGILHRNSQECCQLCGSPLVLDEQGRLVCPKYGSVGTGYPASEAFEHFPAATGRKPAQHPSANNDLDSEPLAWRGLMHRK